jgi:hypothetical protein
VPAVGGSPPASDGRGGGAALGGDREAAGQLLDGKGATDRGHLTAGRGRRRRTEGYGVVFCGGS